MSESIFPQNVFMSDQVSDCISEIRKTGMTLTNITNVIFDRIREDFILTMDLADSNKCTLSPQQIHALNIIDVLRHCKVHPICIRLFIRLTHSEYDLLRNSVFPYKLLPYIHSKKAHNNCKVVCKSRGVALKGGGRDHASRPQQEIPHPKYRTI